MDPINYLLSGIPTAFVLIVVSVKVILILLGIQLNVAKIEKRNEEMSNIFDLLKGAMDQMKDRINCLETKILESILSNSSGNNPKKKSKKNR